MANMFFRKATPLDVPALLPLIISAYRGDSSRKGWTSEADFLDDERIDEAGLLAKLNHPDGQILMAFLSDAGADANTTTTTTTTSAPKLLACCEILRQDPAPSETTAPMAYFGLFAVEPRLQNGGVGRRVLEEAERVAREEIGARVMELTTLWMRTELIAWYERRGFKLIEGETKPFPYEDLVNPKSVTRRDLYFVVLRKSLA